jgi:hypothetical protein
MVRQISDRIENKIEALRYNYLIPTWSSLSSIGKSRVLRSSYIWLFLVPITARLLEKTGTEIKVPIWYSEYTITLGLPFSWKIFYYSSIAFALASFLYSTRCPQLIRGYNRFSEFIDEGKGGRQIIGALYSLIWRPSELSPQRTSDMSVIMQFIEKYCVFRSGHPSESEGPDRLWSRLFREADIPEDRLSEAFWTVRGYADHVNPFSRLFCIVLYFIGFILLFIIAIQNFSYVWRITF